MSYYYGENDVLLPPFRIIATTALSDDVFRGETLPKNRNDMTGESVYVSGLTFVTD
ncbi:hypothetical protein [Thalassospira sp.]|uniref:hypothetical protein n=1 Tax=Thalassospira sp. TaxID=1912094 RepID=UPI0025D84D6F|nr:hypothetical protein [Thalassospira sp.]|tara:strand:- start:903 stop:1070 length:168 start_codon:yes stop_codon:yes gene_type:complete